MSNLISTINQKGTLNSFSYGGLKEQTRWQGPAQNMLIFLCNVMEESSTPYPLELFLLTRVFEELGH